MRKRLGQVAAGVAMLVAMVAAGGAWAADSLWTSGALAGKENGDLARLSRGLVQLVKTAGPAVVQIAIAPRRPDQDLPDEHPPVPPTERPRVGAGFIIRQDGYVVTNNHVIENALDIDIYLAEGTKLPAKVVGRDARADLALLKVDGRSDLPVIPLGDSDALELGELVLAIGNPFGLGETFTLGIVSRKGAAPGASGPFDYIQTDATINPGNSGGPLVNLRGEVVGIATAVIPNRRVGFAIPINLVKALLPELKERGRVAWGFLGVTIQNLNDDLGQALGVKTTRGALVNNVLPGQPAQQAGIRRGDVIVVFDGRPVEDVRDLQRTVGRTPVGKEVEVQILRAGNPEVLRVVVGEMSREGQVAAAPQPPRNLGLTVEEMDAEKAKRFKLPEEGGLIITDVAKDGPAASAGIRPGDLVKEVNSREVGTTAAYRQALKKDGQAPDLFLVKRGDGFFYFALRPRG